MTKRFMSLFKPVVQEQTNHAVTLTSEGLSFLSLKFLTSFLWPHHLPCSALLNLLLRLIPPPLPLLVFKFNYGNSYTVFVKKRDCCMRFNVLYLLPHWFRSHHCSSGMHTAGCLRYHSVLQPPSFNTRNVLMFATPVVFFSNLHFNSWGATCTFRRDNACQAHGNNAEWGTPPLLAAQVLNRDSIIARADSTAGDTSRDCLLLFSMYEHS